MAPALRDDTFLTQRRPAITNSEQFPVITAIDIFVNGITGVFIGMAVLYLAMKLIALVSVIGATGDGPEKTE
jgi:hypothetical protein